ncbi:MAG: cation:proton antiporter [bacterium]
MSISPIWQLLEQNIFITAAVLLIFGFLLGQLVKNFHFPRVSGYIIAGILLGPSLTSLFSEISIGQLDFIPQIALGIIALIIGAGLSFSLIRKLGFSVILITILQALGASVLVLILLLIFKMPLGAALPLAAIATATDPAATIAVIKEFRARGSLTETALAVVALDDAVAIVLFGLVLTIDINHLANFGHTALHSLSNSSMEILGAVLLGLGIGLAVHLILKLTKDLGDSLIIILGSILFSVGLANVLHLSALLTNMIVGITLINISYKNTESLENISRITPPVYCFFFVLSGAHLNLKIFAAAGTALTAWGIIFVAFRIIGKVWGAYFGGLLSQAEDKIRKYLGWMLIPQAGVAVGLPLMITATSAYFPYRSMILNITLIAVAFNIIIGPLCTKIALFKAGEATAKEQ